MFCKTIIPPLAVAGMLHTALATSCNSKFHWGSCDFKEELNATVSYECSNFTVPLDYLDTQSNKTLTLQLTRVPATNGQSQGSIFFNFGGPGLEVRKTLVAQAEQLLTITEGKFDLVGWDARGTANTMPFKCYNDTERPVIMPKHRLEDLGGPKDRPLLARMWASLENFVNDCIVTEENAPEMGEFIGTGYVARDLIQMLDALEGEDALLNYWGLSYGTVLGSTVAAMFPDRMGRVMLDGNVNIPQWYNDWDTVWWSDSDNAVRDFFERCVNAGPELCTLAALDKTAKELNDAIYTLMDELRDTPIPLGGTTVLDASAFKMALRIILYGPGLWPTFATALTELFQPIDDRNMTALVQTWALIASATDLTDALPNESGIAIFCGDKNKRSDDFEEVFSVTGELVNISNAIGEVGNTLVYPCARWPYHVKGAYEGSWHETIKTKNPLLYVGNTYDPVSPLRNAYNGSEIFEGAGVLENGGVGHGFLSHASLCTAKAVRAYFQEGKLPTEGVVCAPNYDAFDTNKTWRDAYLPELGWN